MKTALLSIAALLGLATVASAQSTAFTYQGRLKNGAQPATGLHDFRFRLWDAVSGGTQLGTTQCANNVPLAEGLFTTSIDFGPQFASTSSRFLEIEVRADTGLDCANASGFIVLAPRQAITPAPMASHAGSAFSLAASDGTPANAVIVDSAGNVGIGTGTPTANLQVNGPVPAIVLQDTSGTQQGYLELVDSAGVAQGYFGFGSSSSPHSTIWNRRPGGAIQFGTQDIDRMLISGAGNVGIGTISPTARLDVRGDIRLGPSGQYRAAAGEENLRFIRGTVEFDGTILRGQGFTVDRVNEGDYLITFTTPFSGAPTVTATVDDRAASLNLVDFYVAGIWSANAGSVRVRTRQHSDAGGVPMGASDEMFHFVAVGPR